MTSPRSGFRRAAFASWALAGIGVAGVAGASKLAYAGTLKPVVEEPPALEQALPDPPAAVLSTDPVVAPPPPARVDPAPVRQAPIPAYIPPPAPAPQYTAPQYTAPAQTSAPRPAYTPAPVVPQAPVVSAPAPTKSSFPIRQSHVPVGGGSSGGNKVTPHTVARGS